MPGVFTYLKLELLSHPGVPLFVLRHTAFPPI